MVSGGLIVRGVCGKREEGALAPMRGRGQEDCCLVRCGGAVEAWLEPPHVGCYGRKRRCLGRGGPQDLEVRRLPDGW